MIIHKQKNPTSPHGAPVSTITILINLLNILVIY
jgi:hypothetical protein